MTFLGVLGFWGPGDQRRHALGLSLTRTGIRGPADRGLGSKPDREQHGWEPRPLRIYVTDIILTNSAATAAVVTLVDGALNVIFAANMPATSSQVVANLTTPLRGSPNTALNIQLSSASANINWTIVGYAAQ